MRSAVRTCFCVVSSLAFSSLSRADEGKVFTQQPTVAPSQVRGEKPMAEKKPQAKATDLSAGPAAEWIWGSERVGATDSYLFRKEFEGGSAAATLIATCDNRLRLVINGVTVTESSSWEAPVKVDAQKYLKKGANEITVQGYNTDGPAGLALKMAMKMPDGSMRYVVTDKSWQAAKPPAKGKDGKATKEKEKWSPVVSLGKMGMAPWSDVFTTPKLALGGGLRDVFQVLPGFQVELLYTVPKETQGSWVCVIVDPKGRLIASDEGGKGLFRITPPRIASKDVTKVEPLDLKMTACQGMLFAFGSFYCCVNGGPGSGLYRIAYDAERDKFGEIKLLHRFRGGGEHGPHALRLSPDGKSIFVIAGNHTQPPFEIKRNAPPQTMGGSRKEQLRAELPKGMSSRLPPNWDEDLLLPRQWDANGHAANILAPGGWIAKTDPEGKTWEMFSSGYRNAYDMAFNADGELFAYDADMEWDMGSPWYRPTRVCHATSGSEFGWRSGTGKWPTYYPDSLPAVVDIGPGSPVGVEFGYGTKFPAKYQKALYILDWTFGTIYAIHLKPQGSTYVGEKEEFLSRTPLPLTDATVGHDGALYFTTGGRGTQSELFRVTYVGKESTAAVDARDMQFAENRELRRKLQQYHGRVKLPESGLPFFIFENIGHSDRFVRYAARVAYEDTYDQWDVVPEPQNSQQGLICLFIAAARQGPKNAQANVLKLLEKQERLDYATLTEPLRLDLLRLYQLLFIRLGQPDQATAARIAERLDKFYPAKSDNENRELVQLLVYLNSPTVIEKTLKLMAKKSETVTADLRELIARNPGYAGPIAAMLANHPDLQKVHYAFVLRNMKYGWTLEERKTYFAMLAELRTKSGGASYRGFIDNIRKDALLNCSPAERKAIESDVALQPPKPAELPKPLGPGRKWTVDDLVGLTKNGLSGRNYEAGRRAYAASRCVVCHRFGGEGGATGHDLTNVAGRFGFRDLAESLIQPSKVISDQYRGYTILTDKGKSYTARVLSERDGKLSLAVDAEDASKVVEIPRSEIERMEPSKVSLMPEDLLSTLNKDELLDLLAYLLSRGNPNDRMFQK
jgi:putative heme-binding domain-containing protein